MDPGIIARAKITRAEIARETVAAPSKFVLKSELKMGYLFVNKI